MTSRYQSVTDLPDALRAWSRKPLNSIPADRAPTGYIAGADGENRILADLFAKLCAVKTTNERLGLLASAVIVHQRRYDMGVDSIRGERNPRLVGTMDRSTITSLRPYREMVEVMRDWLDQLHERAMAEIGVGFIDEAARRAS